VDGTEQDSKEWFDGYLPAKVKGLDAHTIAANWSTDEPQLSWSGQGSFVGACDSFIDWLPDIRVSMREMERF